MRETILGPSQPRSRREPLRAIFLAVILGLAAGFVQGWNLSLVGLLLLVVFFNVRARLFVLIWGLGVALSWLLVPLSYVTGRFLLDSTPLGTLLGMFSDTPVVALMGWDRYTVVGGLIIALALSMPTFITIRGWIQSLRASMRPRPNGERLIENQQIDRDRVAIAQPEPGRPGRFACWLLIEENHGPKTIAPLIRPLGVWSLMVGAAVASVGVWSLAPEHVYHRLLQTIAEANHAEIDVGRANFDLWSGHFELTNVAIANPNEMTEDRLRVQKVSADFNQIALLEGRLDIERLCLEGVDCHVLRERLARGFSSHDDSTGVTAEGGNVAQSSGGMDETSDDPRLSEYLSNWSWVQLRLTKLNALGSLLESIQQYDRQPSPAVDRKRPRFRDFCRARSDLGWPRPTITIRSIVVEKLPEGWDLGNQATLRLADVTSNPALCPRPTGIEIEAPQRLFNVRAGLDFRKEPAEQTVDLQTRPFALADLLVPASSRQRLLCESGTITMRLHGTMTHSDLKLHCLVDASDLALRMAGDRPLGGIEPELWNESINQLGSLRLDADIHGTIAAPQVNINIQELARQLERRLKNAGHEQLASRLAGRILNSESDPAAVAHLASPVPLAADEPRLAPERNTTAIQPVAETNVSGNFGPASVEVVQLPKEATALPERLHRLPPIPAMDPPRDRIAAVPDFAVNTSGFPSVAAAAPGDPAASEALRSEVARTGNATSEAAGGESAQMNTAQAAEYPQVMPSAPLHGMDGGDGNNSYGTEVGASATAAQRYPQVDGENEMWQPEDHSLSTQWRKSRLGQWTHNTFVRIRDSWSFKRQPTATGNPFQPDLPHYDPAFDPSLMQPEAPSDGSQLTNRYNKPPVYR